MGPHTPAVHTQRFMNMKLPVVGGLLGFRLPDAILAAHRIFERCAADAQQPAAALQVGQDGAPGRLREIGGVQIDEACAGSGGIECRSQLIGMDNADRMGIMGGMP
ncbi:hypothetical protein D3C75_535390 [compost metagenome]